MMLVIFGPTVTGKTSLAINLAKKFNGEIISADSRQVYKGLDIGSGKVSPESKIEKHQDYWVVDGITTYGFDIVNPGIRFTANDFINYAQSTVSKIQKENKLPIITGGTGFYIKCLLVGLPSSGISPNVKLRETLSTLTINNLYQKLYQLNKNRALALNDSDKNNPRRLIRAIEIASAYHEKKTMNYHPLIMNYLLIGLTASNEFLYRKADKWLEQRLKLGLVEEVQSILANGTSQKWLDDLGLEYRWISRYLIKNLSLDSSVKRLKGDIHHLIRRQKTFFRQFPNIEIFDINKKNYISAIEKKVETFLKR